MATQWELTYAAYGVDRRLFFQTPDFELQAYNVLRDVLKEEDDILIARIIAWNFDGQLCYEDKIILQMIRQTLYRDILLDSLKISLAYVGARFAPMRRDSDLIDMIAAVMEAICPFVFDDSNKDTFRPFFNGREHNYLIDCLYYHIVQHMYHESYGGTVPRSISCFLPSASNLGRRGITIRISDYSDIGCNYNIKIRTLTIPKIVITNTSRSVIKSLIWHEMIADKRVLCDYLLLMNMLIQTESDVEILQMCCVLDNTLDSNIDIVKFFRCLLPSDGLRVSKRMYDDIVLPINSYYHSKSNKYYYDGKNKYLSSPWVVMSLLTGLVLLCATLMQTIYTIMSYYH